VLAKTMKKNTTTTTTMVINICRFDDHRPGFGLNRGGFRDEIWHRSVGVRFVGFASEN
jgi:hypothetical protein